MWAICLMGPTMNLLALPNNLLLRHKCYVRNNQQKPPCPFLLGHILTTFFGRGIPSTAGMDSIVSTLVHMISLYIVCLDNEIF